MMRRLPLLSSNNSKLLLSKECTNSSNSSKTILNTKVRVNSSTGNDSKGITTEAMETESSKCSNIHHMIRQRQLTHLVVATIDKAPTAMASRAISNTIMMDKQKVKLVVPAVHVKDTHPVELCISNNIADSSRKLAVKCSIITEVNRTK